MKISTKGRYALRMMLELALHYPEHCVSVKEIARRQQISGKYLEQIITQLNRAGVVQSTFAIHSRQHFACGRRKFGAGCLPGKGRKPLREKKPLRYGGGLGASPSGRLPGCGSYFAGRPCAQIS